MTKYLTGLITTSKINYMQIKHQVTIALGGSFNPMCVSESRHKCAMVGTSLLVRHTEVFIDAPDYVDAAEGRETLPWQAY
jgi:hypothetical protein